LRLSRFPYFRLMDCWYNLAEGDSTLLRSPGGESKRGRVTLPQNVSPLLRLPKVQNTLEKGKEKTRQRTFAINMLDVRTTRLPASRRPTSLVSARPVNMLMTPTWTQSSSLSLYKTNRV